MRYLRNLAAGILCTGLAGAGAQTASEWKLGVGAQTSAANIDDYHMGVGGSGAIAMERQFGMATDSRVGIRGNWLNFQPEDDVAANSFQQYGATLEALVGPANRFFEPKVGGHIGYLRVDADDFRDSDLLDVGADVMATYKVTPRVDLQALLTPTWLIEDDDTDYQTRGSLNIQISLAPGA